MKKAIIYQPSKTAMQSGRNNARNWVLEYENLSPRFLDPLTGWTGSADMNSQVRLMFETREQATAYARARKLDARVKEPPPADSRKTTASYADNFKPDRRSPWTH